MQRKFLSFVKYVDTQLTKQHCETEYALQTIRHLRIRSNVFLLTILVIVADTDKVFPSAFLESLI